MAKRDGSAILARERFKEQGLGVVACLDWRRPPGDVADLADELVDHELRERGVSEPLTDDYLRAIKEAIDDALPGQVALAQSGRGPMRGDFFAAARRLLAEVERLRGVAAEATKVERERCLNICTFIKRHATGWEMRQAIRARIASGEPAWASLFSARRQQEREQGLPPHALDQIPQGAPSRVWLDETLAPGTVHEGPPTKERIRRG